MGRKAVPSNDSRFFRTVTAKAMTNGRSSVQKYRRAAIRKLIHDIGNSYYNPLYLVLLDPVSDERIVVTNVKKTQDLIKEVEDSPNKRVINPIHIHQPVPGETGNIRKIGLLNEPKHKYKTGPEAREAIQPTLEKFDFLFAEQEEYEEYKRRVGIAYSKKKGLIQSDDEDEDEQNQPNNTPVKPPGINDVTVSHPTSAIKKKRRKDKRAKTPDQTMTDSDKFTKMALSMPQDMNRSEAFVYKFLAWNFGDIEGYQKKKKKENRKKLIQYPSNLVEPPTIPKYVPPPKKVEEREDEGIESDVYVDGNAELIEKAKWVIKSITGSDYINLDDNELSKLEQDDEVNVTYNPFEDPNFLQSLSSAQMDDNFF